MWALLTSFQSAKFWTKFLAASTAIVVNSVRAAVPTTPRMAMRISRFWRAWVLSPTGAGTTVKVSPFCHRVSHEPWKTVCTIHLLSCEGRLFGDRDDTFDLRMRRGKSDGVCHDRAKCESSDCRETHLDGDWIGAIEIKCRTRGFESNWKWLEELERDNDNDTDDDSIESKTTTIASPFISIRKPSKSSLEVFSPSIRCKWVARNPEHHSHEINFAFTSHEVYREMLQPSSSAEVQLWTECFASHKRSRRGVWTS